MMNKEQFFGLLRELLTAVGAGLVTWGISSEGLWQEIGGGVMAAVGIGWALHYHEDRSSLWTLIRKLLSAIAGVAVASGWLDPKKAELLMGIATAAAAFAWSIIDKGGKLPPAPPVIALFAVLFFTSCGNGPPRITEDGCILGSYVRGNRTYWAGPCAGTDGKIDRVRVEWESTQDDGSVVRFRGTVWADRRKTVLEYQLGEGWIGWSSASGLVLGDMPQEVAKSLATPPVAVAVETTK